MSSTLSVFAIGAQNKDNVAGSIACHVRILEFMDQITFSAARISMAKRQTTFLNLPSYEICSRRISYWGLPAVILHLAAFREMYEF